MNAAFFSQRNAERCNLRCSISRADRDTTYTSLTQPGKYGINLLLTLRFFSICRFSAHGEKDPSRKKCETISTSFSAPVKAQFNWTGSVGMTVN